jgi:hypothetical protein
MFVMNEAGNEKVVGGYVLTNITTTSTPTELFLNGSSTRLNIAAGKLMAGTVKIICSTYGNDANNFYFLKFAIRNMGGTTSLVGDVESLGSDIEEIAGCSVSLTADDTNDALAITVTGLSAVTGITAEADDDVLTKTSHGFLNNDSIIFTSLTGGTGLVANTTTYWVINKTDNTFQVSLTRGGSAVNISVDYSDATAVRALRWKALIEPNEL